MIINNEQPPVYKDLLLNFKQQVKVNCTAEVLYPLMGQETAPEVNFTFEGETGKNPDEEDNTFYQRLKSMKEPLEARNIPGIYINMA